VQWPATSSKRRSTFPKLSTKWSTAVIRDGSCGQFLKATVKVGAGEAPAEWLGVAAAVGFEGEDALGQFSEIAGAGGSEDFTLGQPKENLD